MPIINGDMVITNDGGRPFTMGTLNLTSETANESMFNFNSTATILKGTLNSIWDKNKSIILEDKKMENLYNVIIVNKQRVVLVDTKVVGKNQEEVKFDVAHRYLYDNGLKPADVTVLIKDLGSVEVEKELCDKACSK